MSVSSRPGTGGHVSPSFYTSLTTLPGDGLCFRSMLLSVSRWVFVSIKYTRVSSDTLMAPGTTVTQSW